MNDEYRISNYEYRSLTPVFIQCSFSEGASKRVTPGMLGVRVHREERGLKNEK